jgi:hypothetical protein
MNEARLLISETKRQRQQYPDLGVVILYTSYELFVRAVGLLLRTYVYI